MSRGSHHTQSTVISALNQLQQNVNLALDQTRTSEQRRLSAEAVNRDVSILTSIGLSLGDDIRQTPSTHDGRLPAVDLNNLAAGIVGQTMHVGMAVRNIDGTYTLISQQPTTNLPTTPISTPSPWAQDQVTRAISLQLIPPNLQSAYTQATTRAEFAALAVALYQAATGRNITGRAHFNDTTDINVQKMGYLGVVTGVGGGNFAPNQPLTREQAAVMVARLAAVIGRPLPTSAPTFADNFSISPWAHEAVGQMQASGIMGGTGNNNFSPRGAYTREQSIITFLRLFDILD